jgi:hypothetical protein
MQTLASSSGIPIAALIDMALLLLSKTLSGEDSITTFSRDDLKKMNLDSRMNQARAKFHSAQNG